ELDELDPGICALGDFEDEIDAIVRKLDNFGFDVDVETAAAAVDFDDACGVGLHHGTGERAALLRLDFGLELFVLDLFVAFKRDAVDDRIFDDGNTRRPPLTERRNFWKWPVGIKRFTPSSIWKASSWPFGPGWK